MYEQQAFGIYFQLPLRGVAIVWFVSILGFVYFLCVHIYVIVFSYCPSTHSHLLYFMYRLDGNYLLFMFNHVVVYSSWSNIIQLDPDIYLSNSELTDWPIDCSHYNYTCQEAVFQFQVCVLHTEKFMETGNNLQRTLSCAIMCTLFIFSNYIIKKSFFNGRRYWLVSKNVRSCENVS